MKNKLNQFALFVLVFLVSLVTIAQTKSTPKKEQAFKIDLQGEWLFQIDSSDRGETEKWFNKLLDDKIKLPGSMTTNGKGNEISVNTPWTGQIVDSSWFFKPEYAQYRQPGNIKIPFWLQPVKYYKGAAWYQKTINIPASWQGKPAELFIERSHWETTVWIDNQEIGTENSLGTAHVFQLGKTLSPGMHRLTIRVDNRVKDFNVGQNSHSISDHTQSNWNGMIGQLYLKARSELYISDVQLYPDIDKKQVVARITIENETGIPANVPLQLVATTKKLEKVKLPAVTKSIEVIAGSTNLEMIYPMGSNPLLWDEFQPNLYAMAVSIPTGIHKQEQVITFGMRKFSAINTQFAINGRLTFLRGTLECAIFPKTGYPPTDVKEWLRIFTICRSYGLNHIRFHSWCPPEAAFEAADLAGFYLQVECSSWANQGATIGDGKPLDQYIYAESERMVKAYGNHPSFCMMAYGNEPAGNNMVPYLIKFVNFWKAKDNRRLYSNAAGWPVISENNYHSTPDPRIQAWGAGLKSIINGQPPKSDYDWSDIISKWAHPVISHEIGQWCVYPDFKEIEKYTGVLKAKNFEIFKDKLQKNGMGSLADSFLLSSGKLQALCYKADIEAALRTPGFGGFQLLDLHDFPGQGTALVGVLNPFWEDKGYITGREYSRFCNAVVPLARLPKMVYQNDEVLAVPVEIANFGATPLQKITPLWNIKDAAGKLLYQGRLPETDIVIGNGIRLGKISQSLSGITRASRLTLTVTVGKAQNSWDLFVYPATLPELDVLTTAQLDARAIEKLNSGGSVLLTIKKGNLKDEKGGDIKIGFSSIFWNTAWTGGQPPVTLGILVNPVHPALQDFPTEYHSNWQWWDAMTNSAAIQLDSLAPGLNPIVRVIDDWVTARSLGLIFECRVGKGKLMVSGIDLLSNHDNRPAAKQLLYSFQKYMLSNRFNPSTQLSMDKIKGLMKDEAL